MSKLVYIIGNEHGSVFTPKEELDYLRKSQTITSNLIRILAVSERITHLFSESSTEENYESSEDFLAKLVNMGEKESTKLVNEIIKKVKDHGMESLVSYLEIAKVRRLGINIKHYPTECTFFDDEIKLLEDYFKIFSLDKKVDDKFRENLERLTKGMSADERALVCYDIPLISSLLLKTRDFYILSNLKKYSGDKNLIVIGRAHKLEDVSKDKDFKVFRIDVANEFSGDMPKNIREEIEAYASENKVKSNIIYR